MVNEGLIDRKEAVLRVDPEHVDQMLHPQFDPEIVEEARNDNRLLASGVIASPGAAVGQVYFDADTAGKMAHEEGQDVIMVRPFTKPDDVHGMLAAKGILTSEGGATSHAAVVARQFGVPCVVGASMMSINLEKRELRSNGKVIKEGDWISLDGSSGEAYIGKLDLTTPDLEEQKELMTLLDWADENSRLEVWVNADYPADAIPFCSFGAWVWFMSDEHMFFEEERLPHVEKMIINAEEAQKLIDIAERLEAS